jgi:hypothetical protein
MNPSNVIKQQAKALKKSYWEYLATKGFVADEEHSELEKLEAYKQKCKDRKENKK